MITLDGSYGEGGGALIRTALALSTVLKKPFIVNKIRSGRPNPGLKAQHLTAIKALEQIASATTKGAEIRSQSLTYTPGSIKAGTFTMDIGTAGSITLLLQSLLLPALYAPKKIRFKITGGTDVTWSPQAEYLINVMLPHLRRYSAEIKATLIRTGYYPRGRGMLEVQVTPKRIGKRSFNYAHQGSLMLIKGTSHASRDLEKAQVAERQAKGARLILGRCKVPTDIQATYAETSSIGSGITCWAVFSRDKDDINAEEPIILGADALGERNKKAEQVGTECAQKLLEEIATQAPIDSHLADQLIPFLALFGGKITVANITDHTRTNIYVAEKFTDKKFTIRNTTISAS